MKYILSLFLLSILFSFSKDLKHDFTIIPGFGLSEIQIGITSKREVKKLLGKPILKKEPSPFHPFNKKRKKYKETYFYYELYEKDGVKIKYSNTLNKPWFYSKVSSIELLPNCIFKTKEGIGLNSERKDVLRIYGKPDRVYLEDTYEISFKKNSITFIFPKIQIVGKDTLETRVTSIFISAPFERTATELSK
jgi:hypothetical protein